MNLRISEQNQELLTDLASRIEGDLFTDLSSRLMYATDASIYRELPLAVVRPRHENDIRKLVKFASESGIPIIPRGAGTSLAGQVVGNGLVGDISRYMNQILEFNRKERWVRIQPGVVLDELNIFLKPHGLFFGPETSTSNRCMIGGMVGNNACGSHSLIYGSTRDHLIAVNALLSNGETAVFEPLDKAVFFDTNRLPFNFSTLLAGSEGTLAFITEIKLNLVSLPPRVKGLVCIHFHTTEEALYANLVCLKHNPGAVELMDRTILECTRSNI